ncbi:hypothetical protein MTP99_002381 [Tenebrio molitor]|nr:hypothetical protein MTP99_002381 [Tenebrio molitor]
MVREVLLTTSQHLTLVEKEKPNKKCSQCNLAQYCDKHCQKLHWHWHKKVCAKLSEEAIKSSNEETKPAVDAKELSSELQNLLVTN